MPRFLGCALGVASYLRDETCFARLGVLPDGLAAVVSARPSFCGLGVSSFAFQM
jgi:hypothetical protein